MKKRKHFFATFLGFLFVFVFLFSFFSFTDAKDLTSTNFIIRDPVIGTGGGYGTSTNFKLISEGDTMLTGVGSSATYIGHYGFLYYPFVNTPVLTATPVGANADLSWTAAVAEQGWTVDGYNSGIASVSGGPYTYTDVGNVTSYSYTGLAPGDYCFVVEAYDTLGYTIVTSNEQCITISQVITFDLDTDTNPATENTASSVALGVISTSDTRVSGTADGVNFIIAEADTNATNGVVVTVANANGANGLVSTSVPADNINSIDNPMSAGTENYGLCVLTATLSGFSRASPYNSGSCAADSNTNDVQGLTTTGENILNSSTSPVYGAHAEISVNAAISNVTPAHSDYADTLTFIATPTF